jgi:hypothetical protein
VRSDILCETLLVENEGRGELVWREVVELQAQRLYSSRREGLGDCRTLVFVESQILKRVELPQVNCAAGLERPSLCSDTWDE